jgi:hypothetical protein
MILIECQDSIATDHRFVISATDLSNDRTVQIQRFEVHDSHTPRNGQDFTPQFLMEDAAPLDFDVTRPARTAFIFLPKLFKRRRTHHRARYSSVCAPPGRAPDGHRSFELASLGRAALAGRREGDTCNERTTELRLRPEPRRRPWAQTGRRSPEGPGSPRRRRRAGRPAADRSALGRSTRGTARSARTSR